MMLWRWLVLSLFSGGGATAKACFLGTRAGPKHFQLPLPRTASPRLRPYTMDSAHIDERPHKKRRFFAENSSPVHTAPVRHPSPLPVPSPDPTPTDLASPNEAPTEADLGDDGAGLLGFDVGLLQAVVGELEPLVLHKLRDVSGNDVQRGMLLPSQVLCRY